MRRFRVALGAMLCLAIVAGPTPAQARHTAGDWKGRTEDGDWVRMRIDRRVINLLDIDVSYTCDDGSTGEIGFGFGGGQVGEIVDGVATFEYTTDDTQFAWVGYFSHDRAQGTVQVRLEFDHVVCVSGVVSWRAVHLHPPA